MKKVLKATLVLCLVGGAASPSFAQPPPVPLTIDTAAVFAALGRHGTARSNVAQVGFILVSGTVTMGGRPMTPALTGHGITATAVHSHMIGDSPHLNYIHFWADGPLADVLRGLRAAVDAGH